MKIREAIALVDEQYPNGYSEENKIRWLSKLDAMIKRNVIDTHAGGGEVLFSGYDMDTDRETELLAPAPFDAMYLLFLKAQIDLTNMEYEGYNASITLFNTEYEAYENDYNRNHRHIGSGKRFRF